MKMVKKALSYLITLVLIVTAVTSTGVVANATMLPIDEVNAYLIMNGYTKDEVKNVPLSDVLDKLVDKNGDAIDDDIPSDATVVWTNYKDEEGNVIHDEYHVIARNETVDLSYFDEASGYVLELIIGSGNQLDPKNKRYLVKVYFTYHNEISFEIYDENGGSRNKVTPKRKNVVNGSYDKIVDKNGNPIPMINFAYAIPEGNYDNLCVSLNSTIAERPDVSLGVFKLEDRQLQNPITDQILNVDMTQMHSGFVLRNVVDSVISDGFILVYYINGIQADVGVVSIAVSGGYVDISSDLSDGANSVVDRTDESFDFNSDVCTQTNTLKKGFSQSDDYYCTLNASNAGLTLNNKVTKAVVGHYESENSASSLPDIKEQLFGNGYKANYSGNGIDFTVFFEDGTIDSINYYKLTVKVEEFKNPMKEYSDAPVVGAADPWFRVDGVKSKKGSLDVYVVENGKAINMDTLYGYGYQTLLVNDKSAEADLSNAKPTFWFGDADRVETYVGSKQKSGVSSQDFSSGAVQYSTIIDGHVKNYQVNIVKKQSGAKLYVNGPSTREIFLDEYFEYKHDILVANIGDAPLTGLKVELNAENVKLDDYWTIGGSNNDTLAAFTTTETSSKYGELANIGKIRLLPDGDGDVSGTLKISADGQEPVIINLSGRASNPEIITKKLDDAVKYVPYSYVVATNNMNDWNDVTFSREAGSLPEGLQLYPKTGEIYGVPKESGTYNITVKATYSRDDYFEPSYADLTLVVKDNTNDNVYNTSDEGYAIKVHLGTETENSHEFLIENIEEDQLFVSNGELDEFMALWLNGEELEEGVDYTKKSGSTKLTIKSQTFENKANKDGNNTIAMEYRKNGNRDEDLRRTSQNFIVENKSQTDSAVENVISLINSIPAVSNLTLNDKSQVQSARSAYNSLNSSQKGKVTNYSKLTNAESQIKSLEEQEAANRAEAQKVINLINKIPDSISIKDKPTVQTARNGYDGLTYPQKEYVTNYSKLVSVENTISNIEGYISAAQPVIDKIDAIPNQIALENKDLVTTARTAYDKLIAKQKEYVTNYAKLTAAESAIATLELKPDDAKKKIDISDSDKDRKDVNDIKETVADNGTGNNGNSNGQTSSGSNGAIQTGDKNNLAVWYLLLILSWSSLIAMFIRYSKEKKSNVLF